MLPLLSLLLPLLSLLFSAAVSAVVAATSAAFAAVCSADSIAFAAAVAAVSAAVPEASQSMLFLEIPLLGPCQQQDPRQVSEHKYFIQNKAMNPVLRWIDE